MDELGRQAAQSTVVGDNSQTFAEFDTQDSLFIVLRRVGVDVQWRMKGGAVQWVKSLLVIFFSLDIQLDGIKSRFLISVCFCNKHIREERVKHIYVVSKVIMKAGWR